MKAKHLSLTIAALFATGGLWFAWSTLRIQPIASAMPNDAPAVSNPPGNTSTSTLRPPPDPNRRFQDLTPEERVQRARHPGDIGG